MDESNAPLYKWYPDGEINICYNAVDRHVEMGDGEKIAFLYDSVYDHTQEKISYAELQNKVGRIANILRKEFGV